MNELHSSPLAKPSKELDFASPKLQQHHLLRQVIIYIRQSTPQQVLDNRESTARQYALVDRAAALGWPQDQILVIDEDQGLSGQSIAGRVGFQRSLKAIRLNRVGLMTIPLAFVVQLNGKEIRFDKLRHETPSTAPTTAESADGCTQRSTETIDNGRGQEETSESVGLLREHLTGEVILHRRSAPG